MSSKIIDNLRKGLESSHETEVLLTLERITVQGSPLLLPDLVKLISVTESGVIKSRIESILNNLKDPATVPVMLGLIQSAKEEPIRKLLISSCWQCGLDYSSHSLHFAEIIASSPMETAIEAFSVIESHLEIMDEKERQLLKTKLEELVNQENSLNPELLEGLLDEANTIT